MREKISSGIRETDKMEKVFILFYFFKLDRRINLASLHVYTLGWKRINHGHWMPVKYLASHVTNFLTFDFFKEITAVYRLVSS